MSVLNILSLICGLALFLYGMNLMGEGLEKLSGGKLEKILERLTSSKFKAVLLGLIVTAIIQSSSATTVMTVGFVSSGIMSLSQAVGVIMGANIGTTVTSWILSLTGIQSNNIILSLFKPSSFAPILAMVGVILIMFIKNEKKATIGRILTGFAILMVGMENMTAAVKPLANVPEFASIMTAFSNPILGVIAGAVLTAIIQSSSASVGILQALCLTGTIRYSVALPIIMGQNIGTCITAILSSIGTSKDAKRTACVHLSFNIIGTVVLMSGFYIINIFADFAFLDTAAGAAGIAIIHSIFNILATALLLPFSKQLEMLAIKLIPDSKEEGDTSELSEEFKLLDSRFLETPSYAIIQSKRMAEKMFELSREALLISLNLLTDYDKSKQKRVSELEELVDTYEDELSSYLIKLTSKDLSIPDSRTLTCLLHSISDFERISDHAVNIMESAKKMNKKELSFSAKANQELMIYTRALIDIVDTSLNVFEKDDIERAKGVEALEEVIDYLNKQIRKRHIKRLEKGKCTIELGIILTDICTDLERVSDHCSNIALNVIQLKDENYDAHEYVISIKKDNTNFKDSYHILKSQYVLP